MIASLYKNASCDDVFTCLVRLKSELQWYEETIITETEGCAMKRMMTVGGIVLLLLLGWRWVDVDRLFADVYYTKVPNAEATNQGTTYTYEMIGYDEEGKKRPITFRTPTRLAEGDFLKVYIKDERKVTAYESVVESEVPAQLKDEQTDEPVSIPLP
jgi:uncharacterized protein (TIGR01655 family)